MFGLGIQEIMILYVMVLVPIYFLPSIIAWWTVHPNKITIFVINLLLGWSLIGWIAALIWAFVRPSPVPSSSINGNNEARLD